jgi:hypothetical protein
MCMCVCMCVRARVCVCVCVCVCVYVLVDLSDYLLLLHFHKKGQFFFESGAGCICKNIITHCTYIKINAKHQGIMRESGSGCIWQNIAPSSKMLIALVYLYLCIYVYIHAYMFTYTCF